jgi:hypothetical protein
MKGQKDKDAASALKQSEAMAADQFWRCQCKLSQGQAVMMDSTP